MFRNWFLHRSNEPELPFPPPPIFRVRNSRLRLCPITSSEQDLDEDDRYSVHSTEDGYVHVDSAWDYDRNGERVRAGNVDEEYEDNRRKYIPGPPPTAVERACSAAAKFGDRVREGRYAEAGDIVEDALTNAARGAGGLVGSGIAAVMAMGRSVTAGLGRTAAHQLPPPRSRHLPSRLGEVFAGESSVTESYVTESYIDDNDGESYSSESQDDEQGEQRARQGPPYPRGMGVQELDEFAYGSETWDPDTEDYQPHAPPELRVRLPPPSEFAISDSESSHDEALEPSAV